MAPQGYIVPRSTNSHVPLMYIAGFCIAGGLVLGGVIWLGVRLYLKRARRSNDSFPPPVLAYSEKDAENHLPFSHAIRNQKYPAVIFPEKVLARPNAIQQGVIQQPAEMDSHSRISSPFLFALSIGKRRALSPTNSGSNHRPSSHMSSGSHSSFSVDLADHRLSVVSAASSLDQAAKCKVRQIFDPVLPDELVLRVGERVTLVRHFDDGWCIVGRPSLSKADDVEFGAIPDWCFTKPAKGRRPQRPMRSASLGITAGIVQPYDASREDVMSWSKF